MLMPPFIGVDSCNKLSDLHATPTGYVPVKDSYQHTDYPNVWAAGIAVNVPLPFTPGKVPYASPKQVIQVMKQVKLLPKILLE